MMKIFVRTISGHQTVISIEDDDTVANLKDKVYSSTGLPADEQRLFFGGHELHNERYLQDIGITDKVVVQLLHNPRPQVSSKQPMEMTKEPLLDDEDEDADEYILNPQAHFRKIDALIDAVVKSSEYFLCRGAVNLEDVHFDPAIGFSSHHCDSKVWDCINEFRGMMLPVQAHETHVSFQNIFGSLAKSYLILCKVLDSLDLMTQKGFCASSYSILIQHTDNYVAELVRLESQDIIAFQMKIAAAILQICKRSPLTDEDSNSTLQTILSKPLISFAYRLHLTPLGTSLPFTELIILCRLVAVTLDLGLVAYAGSHGSRFDIDYLRQDVPELRINCLSCRFSFTCGLRRLACLDEFLDRKKVWVFHPWVGTTPQDVIPAKILPLDDNSNALAVLTYIEDFRDVWGPVWAINISSDAPNYILRYDVSKGFICRSEQGPRAPISGALCCHWYSWSSTSFPVEPISKDSFIKYHDRLLIGTPPPSILRENHACTYTLDDYERGYSHEMAPLGTEASRWYLDSRNMGASVSQYVGISASGTQKKLPQTSLKQHIWDKWNNSPESAKSGMLNLYLGVEISHCTGNARRIRIRDLFFVQPIRAYLDEEFPGWDLTDYGDAFLQALLKDEDNDVQTLWRERYQYRGQIGTLVCSILSLLHKTGVVDGRFVAVFLNDDREYSMPLSLRSNDWAGFLQDSPLTAVYAIINKKCLECHALGHYTSICSSSPPNASSFTVLETQIALMSAQGLSQRIWLDRGGCLRRVSERDDSILLFNWESSRLRELGASFARLLSSEQSLDIKSREVRDQKELGARKFRVCLQAGTPSYGGLQRKRVHRPNELGSDDI